MWLEFDDDLLFESLLVDIKKICISASKWTVRFLEKVGILENKMLLQLTKRHTEYVWTIGNHSLELHKHDKLRDQTTWELIEQFAEAKKKFHL